MTDDFDLTAEDLERILFRARARRWFAHVPTFYERYPDIAELLREWGLLRNWNKRFMEGDPQDELLLFAEGSVVIVALERFVRAVLGSQALDTDTLDPLLRKATAGPEPLLILPWDDQDEGRKKICKVRNTILHGNFEQAARGANHSSTRAYFKKSYASEIHVMGLILLNLMEQIDLNTGKRISEVEPQQ
jgi:hypothetical protein